MSATSAKVRHEGRCRNCGSRVDLQAAHTIPRSLGGKSHADSVIPLCATCHRLQHDRRLELLPLMNIREQIAAVNAVGLARAYRYLTNQ